MLDQIQKQGLNGTGNGPYGVGLGVPGLLNDMGHAAAEGREHRGEDVLLVAEVGVETAHGTSGFGHDHGDGGGVIAVGGEEAGGGIEEGIAAGLLADGGCGGRSVDHSAWGFFPGGLKIENDVAF